jgi:uncharacterized protein YcfJ
MQMKTTKLVSVMIMAGALFGAAQASGQVIDETRTGYVTGVETVWTQRIVQEPVTTRSCETVRSHSRLQGNVGDMVVGGLVGSAIGNKLSDNHGAGSLGALFGAMAAMDRTSGTRKVCRDRTTYHHTTEQVADHYVIHVRSGGRNLSFRSNHRYRVNQSVRLSVSSNYGLLR